MQNQNKSKTNSLKKATQYFLAGVVAIIAGIIINATSTSCTVMSGGIQFCTVTTYYGLDAHTFMIILFVVAFICLAMGAVYFRKHQQAQ